jgi:hypothetical protein
LTERKAHLQDLLFNLGIVHNNLRSHFRQVTVTDGRLANIEEFCAKIRKGLNYADFNSKRQIIELLDIKGKVAFENGERVLHLKCLITFQEQQPVLRIPILLSSNSAWQHSIELTAGFIFGGKFIRS